MTRRRGLTSRSSASPAGRSPARPRWSTRLIAEFTRRGLVVATVKHAHHAFQIDDAETDSARHRRAGARRVAVVSDKRWAVISELAGEPEPDLAEVAAWLAPAT